MARAADALAASVKVAVRRARRLERRVPGAVGGSEVPLLLA